MSDWKTEITSIKENEILVRGYAIEDIMQKLSFAESIFLIIKGKLPTIEEGKVFNAVLCSSIDHGATPPSALATLNATSTGAPLNGALASGLLAINNFHGGAIQNAMNLFEEAFEYIGKEFNIKKIEEFVLFKFENNFRFPGFGHRVHKTDPRSIALFNICKENFSEEKMIYLNIAKEIENQIISIKRKKLPINVDGMIGAVLLTLDFPKELANGVFMMSRIPGLMAHFVEEKNTQKPMRHIEQKNVVYTGKEKTKIKRS